MAGSQAHPRPHRLTLLLSLVLAGALVACWNGISAWSSYSPRIDSTPALDRASATLALRASLAPLAASPSAFERMWNADIGGSAIGEADPGAEAEPVYFAWADPGTDAAAPFEALFKFPGGALGPPADLPSRPPSRVQSEAECLATAVYFEARGEGKLGQLAVAQVILNRVKAHGFPKTVCGVVYQNAGERHRCQFSFACDGVADRTADRAAWRASRALAEEALASPGGTVLADIGNATHYHAAYASPAWADRMQKVDVIGRHVFYAAYRG